MIDYFALALGHGLLAIAFLRLVMRSDLDDDPSFHARPETSEPREEVNRAAARSLLRRQNKKRLASQDQREGGG